MKIVLGADHGGVELKNYLKEYLLSKDILVSDVGINDPCSVDYPDIVKKVTEEIKSADFGILVCGTGIGVSIAANKVKGIRAALCSNEYCARMARQHNDANILCLGGRVLGKELAKSITDVFLNTDFLGGKHQVRVDKITDLEYYYKD